MDRRAFIAATSVGVAAATAGCGVLGDTRRLSAPRTQTDDEGRETDLVFEDEGRRVAAFTVSQRADGVTGTDPFKLRLHLSHRSNPERYDDHTTVDRFRFGLRTPPMSDHGPAEIYMQAPRAGLQDVLDFHETQEGWTWIGADDPGDLGAGTINVSTIVAPVGQMAGGLDVRIRATLSESGIGGTTYELADDTRFDPV